MSSSQVLAHDWFPRRLPANVEIGPASWLYSSYAFVHYCSRRACGLRVGHDTGLYHGTFFDLGPEGEVVIGDYCTVVGAIFATRGRVELGSYSFVAHEVVIADEPSAVPPGARSIGRPAAARFRDPHRPQRVDRRPGHHLGRYADRRRGGDRGRRRSAWRDSAPRDCRRQSSTRHPFLQTVRGVPSYLTVSRVHASISGGRYIVTAPFPPDHSGSQAERRRRSRRSDARRSRVCWSTPPAPG